MSSRSDISRSAAEDDWPPLRLAAHATSAVRREVTQNVQHFCHRRSDANSIQNYFFVSSAALNMLFDRSEILLFGSAIIDPRDRIDLLRR